MAFMGYLQKFFIKLNQQRLFLLIGASNMPAHSRGDGFDAPGSLGRIMLSRCDLGLNTDPAGGIT